MDLSSMQVVRLFAIALMVGACQHKPAITVCSNGDLTFIDSTFHEGHFTAYKENHEHYPIYYLGKLADTLLLTRNGIPRFNPDANIADTVKIAIPDSTSIKLVVDTTLVLTLASRYFNESGREIQDSAKYYHAHAILIYNLSDLPLYLGELPLLRFVKRQTLDPLGNWTDINQDPDDFCGTAATSNYVQHAQIAVAKLVMNTSSRKQPCRLKFRYGGKEIYSNVFMDGIKETNP